MKAMMHNSVYKIVIIGGGASGLMLAAGLDIGKLAPGDLSSGIILEGSVRPGSKLLMSGGGHCNITHEGSIKDFLNAYGKNGRALRRCLYRHSNIELCEWFASRGLPLTSRDERFFPASMKAKDVLDLLLAAAEANKWVLETDSKVTTISLTGDAYRIEVNRDSNIYAESIVIATGGITYPETGSDGSMFELLSDLGVSITEPRSALAPVYVKDYPYAKLSGISVPDVTVTVSGSNTPSSRKAKSVSMTGDILFTHRGFSGPAILNISKYASVGETIRLNYNKALSELPRRMQHILEDRSRGDSGDIRTKVLASLLRNDEFVVEGIDPHGMVTSGGVSLDDIDLSTMQIKSAPAPGKGAIYVIGEAIDADGITGGYNLQLCWSTALTAADTIRQLLL